MRPYGQGALRWGFPLRKRPACRHRCRPSYLAWALLPRRAPVVLGNSLPPEGDSPCPAGSLARFADPELQRPPADRYPRWHGGSFSARAARVQDAMMCPCRPSLAAWNPSPRALGDPDPAAPVAHARVSLRARVSDRVSAAPTARARASLAQQPVGRVVLHYAPALAHPVQGERGALQAAGGRDGKSPAPQFRA